MLRGGAYRLLFSPYFLVANYMVFTFMFFKYWSATNAEIELFERVHFLEAQIQNCQKIKLESVEALSLKSKSLQACQEDVQHLRNTFEKSANEERNNPFESPQINKTEEELRIFKNCTANLIKSESAISVCSKSLSESADLLEKMNISMQECALKQEKNHTKPPSAKLTFLDKDRSNESQSNNKNQPSQKESVKASNGQLPNVDPSAVSVRVKPSIGMKYHTDSKGDFLPILPRGDPNAPRPSPRFSVVNPPESLTQGTNAINNLKEKVLTPEKNAIDIKSENKTTIALRNKP